MTQIQLSLIGEGQMGGTGMEKGILDSGKISGLGRQGGTYSKSAHLGIYSWQKLGVELEAFKKKK